MNRSIGHGGPVVINLTVHIGNNCNLSQFVTISSNKGKGAVIGDNVYIVEDARIGDNVTIGADSVVTKNIPDNATAVGNYAIMMNPEDLLKEGIRYD